MMTKDRFDSLNGATADFVMANGLVDQNEEERAEELRLFSSSVSLSTIWRSKDDTKKLIAWDNALEEYLEHRALLIRLNPIAYLPWKIQQAKGIQLVNTADSLVYGVSTKV